MKIQPVLNNSTNNNNMQKINFQGRASNAFYKKLFNETQSTDVINSFEKILKKKTGKEYLVDTLGKEGNIISLTTVKFLPPKESAYTMASDTVDTLNFLENNTDGLNKTLLIHYATAAERKPFSAEKMTAADVADLREDCRAIMKYQKENRVGLEKGEDLVFSWARVKRNLKINDIDPNPSQEAIEKARIMKADTLARAAKETKEAEHLNAQKHQEKTTLLEKIKNLFI